MPQPFKGDRRNITVRMQAADTHKLQAFSDITGDSKSDVVARGAIVAVKDIMRINGWAASGATGAFRMEAGSEAAVITRLRAAGAVIIGTANLHALAYGPFSTSSDFGAVGNPLNRGSGRRRLGGRGHRNRHCRVNPHAGGAMRGGRTETHIWVGAIRWLPPLARTLDHIGPSPEA